MIHQTFNVITISRVRNFSISQLSESSSQNSFLAHPQLSGSKFRFYIITVSLCLVSQRSHIALQQTVSLSIKYNLAINLSIEPLYKLPFMLTNSTICRLCDGKPGLQLCHFAPRTEHALRVKTEIVRYVAIFILLPWWLPTNSNSNVIYFQIQTLHSWFSPDVFYL